MKRNCNDLFIFELKADSVAGPAATNMLQGSCKFEFVFSSA